MVSRVRSFRRVSRVRRVRRLRVVSRVSRVSRASRVTSTEGPVVRVGRLRPVLNTRHLSSKAVVCSVLALVVQFTHESRCVVVHPLCAPDAAKG
jgi:hypothetical protein